MRGAHLCEQFPGAFRGALEEQQLKFAGGGAGLNEESLLDVLLADVQQVELRLLLLHLLPHTFPEPTLCPLRLVRTLQSYTKLGCSAEIMPTLKEGPDLKVFGSTLEAATVQGVQSMDVGAPFRKRVRPTVSLQPQTYPRMPAHPHSASPATQVALIDGRGTPVDAQTNPGHPLKRAVQWVTWNS